MPTCPYNRGRSRSHGAAPASPTAHADDGFTLIELLVAMFIAIIALSMVVTTLRDGFAGAERTIQSTRVDARAAAVIDLFGTDLRLAIAPDREGEVSPDDLRASILFNRVIRDWDRRVLDVDDLRVATSNEITFLSDVDRTRAGTECVTWRLNGTLVRTVRANGCGGAIIESRVMLEPAAPQFRANNIFTYTRLVNTNLSAGNIDRRNCRRETTQRGQAASSRLQRSQVVNVTIDVRGFFQAGVNAGANAESTYVSAVNMRNRLNRDYLYALGCSY